MHVKIIETKVDKGGVIHVVDPDLQPGDVDIIIMPHTSEPSHSKTTDIKKLPIGGYKAGWFSPKQLRREALYEDSDT